jgi:hypothetical protein
MNGEKLTGFYQSFRPQNKTCCTSKSSVGTNPEIAIFASSKKQA